MKCIDLSLAGKGNFEAKRGLFTVALWFVIETLVIKNRLMPLSRIRVALLRLFGAQIGRGCRCPHAIRVKYPWNLTLGDNVWLGEDVWLYNQAQITVGSNVCISQGAFLTAGSHDVSGNMDLRVAPIVIEDGVWISTRAIVQMGVTVGRSAVVTPNSVVHRSLAGGFIYGGNPCRAIKPRFPSPCEPQPATPRLAEQTERFS
jgi:putative colanic acid biosynthesis acetyltransferase WcaF